MEYDRQRSNAAAADANSKRLEDAQGFNLYGEILSLCNLAWPTIIILLSFMVPPFLAASYVGRHFGHLYLDAYTLANLTANLLKFAVLQGFFDACDTLAPQSFAASNYREVGFVVQRCFIASMVVMVLINAILFVYMDDLLVILGQDSEVVRYTQKFYFAYALGLPFNTLYTVAWKFLSAQDILRPLVVVSSVSILVVLPICLEVFVQSFGFVGAAFAIAVNDLFLAVSLVAWICLFQPHHDGTWPNLISTWRESLAWDPFKTFLLLGFGGMMASLEWVYWEALSLMVGSLGVLPLSAHTVPTQVTLIQYLFPYGIGIAVSIKLGAAMTHDVPRAKRLACAVSALSFVLFSVTSWLLYVYRLSIISMFTSEAEVIELCDGIWHHVCFYLTILSVFGTNIGIAKGLGMQWTLGVVVVVALWLLGMPASYYFAVVCGGGLEAVWACIWPPYLFINVVMLFAFVRADWDKISLMIRLREGMVDDIENLSLIECTDLSRIEQPLKPPEAS